MNTKIGIVVGLVIAVAIAGFFVWQKQRDAAEARKPILLDLKIDDIEVGKGRAAAAGKLLTVHYTGTFLDGRKFDSSRDRAQPMVFRLGEGAVIRGWDVGLVGMKEGGKRKLTVPPSMAYGDNGAGDLIPPRTSLLFEIELLKVE